MCGLARTILPCLVMVTGTYWESLVTCTILPPFTSLLPLARNTPWVGSLNPWSTLSFLHLFLFLAVPSPILVCLGLLSLDGSCRSTVTSEETSLPFFVRIHPRPLSGASQTCLLSPTVCQRQAHIKNSFLSQPTPTEHVSRELTFGDLSVLPPVLFTVAS